MFYHKQGRFSEGGTRADENRRDKRSLVRQGRSHGVVVYADETPVGWCQYGTKEELPRLDAFRTYSEQAYDGKRNLWRITCFFVDRDYRGKGVANFALKSALALIRKKGGGMVEAYPLESLRDVPRKTAKGKASFLWNGTASMFKETGFKVVAPLGKSRRLVRKNVL